MQQTAIALSLESHAFDAEGCPIALSLTLPQAPLAREFYYCTELARGQCGIRRHRSQSSLIMHFEQTDFPYVWVLQSYGGWRDFYTMVMEPCTTIPYDLETDYQHGTTAVLQPEEQPIRTLTIRIQDND